MNQQITYSRCPSCYSPFLQYVGAQTVCLNCNSQPSNLQHQTRVVPEQYQSNCKNSKELEKQRRLNALIREFSDKYREFKTSEQMAHFRQKLKAIKMATQRKKGSREAAAVVVYCEMHEDIKLNIKQYCRYNNLNIKIFHQKYKILRQMSQQLNKVPQIPQDSMSNVKIQQKLQESFTTEKLSDRSQQLESELMSNSFQLQSQKFVVQGTQHAVQLIYDDIFKKYIYKQKKVQIINGLIKKIDEIDSKTLSRLKYGQNKVLKLYYLIFAVVKYLGHKISFADFSRVIKAKTGFIMKRKTASEIKKLYEKKDENKEMYNQKYVKKEQKEKKQDSRQRIDISDSELSFM